MADRAIPGGQTPPTWPIETSHRVRPTDIADRATYGVRPTDMADRDTPRGQTHRHGRSRPPTGVRPTDMADRDIPGGQTHRRVCWSRGYSGATGVPCVGL